MPRVEANADGLIDSTWFTGTTTSQLESLEGLVASFGSRDATVTVTALATFAGAEVDDLMADLALWISRQFFSPASASDAARLAVGKEPDKTKLALGRRGKTVYDRVHGDDHSRTS